MLYRTVAAALAITLIAILNGCAVTVGYEEPLDEPAVGSRVMVQQRTASAAVQTPEPPKPPKEPEPPKPLDAVASSSTWTLLPLSAGTLAGGVLTSSPTCDAATGAISTQGATAELTVSLAPFKGNDCTVKLTGDMGLLRMQVATIPRTGTNYTCTQAGDTTLSANVGDGDGWNVYGGGNVKLPPNAIHFPTLTPSVGLRVRLRGDSAAHLGEVTATVHCAERL